jgi:hypothetical protein
MISVNPQGNIYLCKTPLENDYANQLTFANATAQQTYFNSTVVKTYDNNTYIRKDGGIKINASADEVRQCNYMFYRNTGFDNRIYYCFITEVTYLSENSCFLKIETDCFQTWYFDIAYKPCFIEREHVNDDTVGKHTVPEGLETGEYVCNLSKDFSPLPSDTTWQSGYTYEGSTYMIAFQVSQLLPSMYAVADVAQNYNGVYSGLWIVGVDNADDARNFIKGYDSEGKGNAIVSCFLTYPHFFNAGFQQAIGTHGYSVQRLYPAKTGDDNTHLKANMDMNTTGSVYDDGNFERLDGYTPHNNKLKTYPYCYYLADNNAGSTAVYRKEFFNNDATAGKAEFSIRGAIGQGNSIKLIPMGYKNVYNLRGNYQEGLQASKLPVCAWASDYYLNWESQNAVNMIAGATGSVLSSAVAGATVGGAVGLVGGALASGISAVAGAIGKESQAQVMPDQAKGNANVSDLNIGYYGTGNNASLFNIKAMCIRAEYAQIIDNYFDMFGYKVNLVKTPNITGRRYWNYVKTIDCNVDGDIPQEDLQVIRKMFDKGCTFWHGASNMYNYNLTNDILT